jgi:hypothetical protein
MRKLVEFNDITINELESMIVKLQHSGKGLNKVKISTLNNTSISIYEDENGNILITDNNNINCCN